MGKDIKGKLSPVFYIIAIPAAFLHQQWLADAMYVLVALMWLVPDRRIERVLYAEQIETPVTLNSP